MMWPLSLGQIASVLVLAAISYIDLLNRKAGPESFILMSSAVLIGLLGPLGYWWAQRGHARQGKFIFLASSLLALTIAVLYYGPLSSLTFFFTWPIMVASILIRARAGFVIALVSSVILTLVYVLGQLNLVIPRLYGAETIPPLRLITIILSYLLLSYLTWLLAHKWYDAILRERQQAQKLAAANKFLTEANQLKSEFIGIVSHELRTPLNCAMGYTELLMNGVYGTLSDVQMQKLRLVHESTEKLLGHINAMLNLSDIHTGQFVLKPEVVQLERLLKDGIAGAETPANLKGLTIITYVEKNLPGVYADPRQLRLVLNNLLSNAIKFTHQGGVEIRCQQLDKNRDFKHLPPKRRPLNGQWIGIKVIDTGVGIPPEMQEVIFDEFRQVDGSSTRRFGGMGLGLALSRRLIEMQGGYIWVESAPNRGSTFTFALPAADNHQE
ncbi:MAG: sensor histidine kinase [Anaerolineae bacterium]